MSITSKNNILIVCSRRQQFCYAKVQKYYLLAIMLNNLKKFYRQPL